MCEEMSLPGIHLVMKNLVFSLHALTVLMHVNGDSTRPGSWDSLLGLIGIGVYGGPDDSAMHSSVIYYTFDQSRPMVE